MNKSNESTQINILNLTITVLLFVSVALSIVALLIIPNYSVISNWFKPTNPIDPDKDFITVFDVGEADATLICSNGQTVLVDTGTSDFENDLCAEIYDLGIKKLDAVFISHLHDDHTGGLSKVVEQFEVANLIVPDLNSKEDSAFMVRKAKNDVLNDDGNVYTAVEGMVLNCGRFEITVLGYYSEQKDENNRSIFLMAKHNDIKFLFTGDAESEAEKMLIENNINFDCDILKVGHHGSETSTSENFLKIATPRYAVISCGSKNQYGHPNSSTLDLLSKCGAEIRRTDIHGNITFHFYSDEINVSCENYIEN